MQTRDVKYDNQQIYLIKVNGKKFEIGKTTFSRLEPFLELNSSTAGSRPDGRPEYFLERHAQSFAAILDYYQTGELHMPTDVCPVVFQRELEVWGISWKVMDEASLTEFDRTLFETPRISDSQPVSCLGRIRSKGWALLDDPRSSFGAKVFLAIATVFVVMSIFVLAAATHKSFHRALKTEEWVEFLSEEEILECWEDLYPEIPSPKENLTKELLTTTLKKVIDTTSISSSQPLTSFLLINSSTCYQATGAQLRDMLKETITNIVKINECSKVRPADAYAVQDWLVYVEIACIAYFTLEFFARLVFAPSKRVYLCSVFTMIDFVSVAVMYLVILLKIIDPEAKYTPSYIDVINCLQLVRVLRFFRLVKYVIGFRVLVFSVRSSWRELSLLVMYIAMAVTIFSTVIYFLERDNMKSIPEASWWVIVTMTTVGYGDMAPNSFKGKLIGSLCAISGVLLIAVTVPVFVNNFLLFYEHSKIKEAEIEDMKQNLQAQSSAEFMNTQNVQNGLQNFTNMVLDVGPRIGKNGNDRNDEISDDRLKPSTKGQWLNKSRPNRPEVSKSKVTPFEHM